MQKCKKNGWMNDAELSESERGAVMTVAQSGTDLVRAFAVGPVDTRLGLGMTRQVLKKTPHLPSADCGAKGTKHGPERKKCRERGSQ